MPVASKINTQYSRHETFTRNQCFTRYICSSIEYWGKDLNNMNLYHYINKNVVTNMITNKACYLYFFYATEKATQIIIVVCTVFGMVFNGLYITG